MTKEEAAKELQRLSHQIDDLIEDREKFIVEYMQLFTDFHIGQKVIDRDTLRMGKVISHYQATYGQPPKSLHHTNFDVHCCIEIQDDHPNKLIDNTSRYTGGHPWMDAKEFWEKRKYNLI